MPRSDRGVTSAQCRNAARGPSILGCARLSVVGLILACALGIFAATASASDAYTISGTVEAQGTGLGVAEVQIIVREIATEKQIAATQTSLGGSYTIEMPGGTYNIEFVPPTGSGYGTFQDRGETVSTNKTINVLLVPAGSSRFSGHLLGPGGVALANALVSVGAETVTTGADGSFSVSLAPGSYGFEVSGYRQSGVSPSVVPSYFGFWGGHVSLSSSLNENITLPLHAVTIKTVGPGGSPIPGVKFSGGLSQISLGGEKSLASGVTAVYGTTGEQESTNSSGEATLSVADIETSEATIEAVPPSGSGVVRTPINLAKVTASESRELHMSAGVTFSGHLLGPGGVALANALVSVGAETVTTGADGSFSVSLAPGSYGFEVSGYRQSGVSPSVVPSYFGFWGGHVSLSSSLNENITLPLHAVTIKTVGPGGSPIPGVKFSGGLSQISLGGKSLSLLGSRPSTGPRVSRSRRTRVAKRLCR